MEKSRSASWVTDLDYSQLFAELGLVSRDPTQPSRPGLDSMLLGRHAAGADAVVIRCSGGCCRLRMLQVIPPQFSRCRTREPFAGAPSI